MNPLRIIFGLILLLSVTSLKAQEVRLITIDQLEGRIARGKDTTYIINFWPTWCGPCVAELPGFEKLRLSNEGKPLKILLVSLDFKSKLEPAVKPFVRKAGLKNEVLLLNESNQQEYIDRISKDWSGAIPATLFANGGKKVRKFYEKELTFEELNTIYQSFK